jgi:hypothetical protein
LQVGALENTGSWGAPCRPFIVRGALALFACFALLKAFLAVFVFSTIRDDQLHEVNGVPGGLWLLFGVLLVSAVLDVILGVFIFRAARWAWIAALALAAVSLATGAAAIALSDGGASITGLIPDIATRFDDRASAHESARKDHVVRSRAL